jgi:hypothetical protein
MLNGVRCVAWVERSETQDAKERQSGVPDFPPFHAGGVTSFLPTESQCAGVWVLVVSSTLESRQKLP